jgi:anti-sigma factor RsiW
MKCDHIRQSFVEGGLSAETAEHLRGCSSCAEAWAEHQKLFSLLDEWSAPAPSPFFDTRLMARVREIKAEEANTPQLLAWLRRPTFGMPRWRPVAAGALAVAMAVGVGVMSRNTDIVEHQAAVKGTAVEDLRALDNHQDEISNLDLLDDLNAADNGNQDTDEL